MSNIVKLIQEGSFEWSGSGGPAPGGDGHGVHDVTLGTTVVAGNCIVIATAYHETGSPSYDRGWCKAKMQDNDTIEFERSYTGSFGAAHWIFWCVVEFEPSAIDLIERVIDVGPTTAEFDVTLSAGHTAGRAIESYFGMGSYHPAIHLTSDTNFRLNFASAAPAASDDGHAQVVTFADGVIDRIQREEDDWDGDTDSTSTSKTDTIDTLVEPYSLFTNQSVKVGSGFISRPGITLSVSGTTLTYSCAGANEGSGINHRSKALLVEWTSGVVDTRHGVEERATTGEDPLDVDIGDAVVLADSCWFVQNWRWGCERTVTSGSNTIVLDRQELTSTTNLQIDGNIDGDPTRFQWNILEFGDLPAAVGPLPSMKQVGRRTLIQEFGRTERFSNRHRFSQLVRSR